MSRFRPHGEGIDVTRYAPRRFVLLHHHTAEDEHLDLMLETDAAAPLATWRLEFGAELPAEFLASQSRFRCTPLPPHRRDYLTYEGSVSGGRGTVTQVAAGEFWGDVTSSGAWSIVVNQTHKHTKPFRIIRLSGDTMTHEPLVPSRLVLVRNRVAESLDDAITARWNPLVLPPLYDLPAGDQRIEELRRLQTTLTVILTWLAPRALCALLRFLKFDADWLAKVVIVPLTSETTLDELEPLIAAACVNDESRGTATPQIANSANVARRWYPLIDYAACVGCLECVNFCLFGVYDVGRSDIENGDKPLVVKPDACRDGCPACARVCPGAAIVFAMHDEPLIAGRLDAAASQEAYRAAASQGETATQTRAKHTESSDALEQLVRATDAMDV